MKTHVSTRKNAGAWQVAYSVAATLGEEEIDYSNELVKRMLAWFDNLNNLIPSWYSDDEVW